MPAIGQRWRCDRLRSKWSPVVTQSEQHRGRRQCGQGPALLHPGALRPGPGMREARQPDEIEGPDLQRRTILTQRAGAERQQPVDDEEGDRGDDHAGHRADSEALDDAHASQAELRVLLAPQFQPEQVACRDQHAACQAQAEIDPAQAPVAKLNEVKARDEALARS